MNANSLLDAIQNSAPAQWVSKSDHLVGAGLQILHILGFILLLASLVLVSLRLLGWALPEQPLERIAQEAGRLTRIGLALVVVSGVLIFIATPRLYVGNWAFQAKMGLFLAAALAQIFWFRRVLRQPQPRPRQLRAAVAATLLLWFGVALAGRMIGFI